MADMAVVGLFSRSLWTFCRRHKLARVRWGVVGAQPLVVWRGIACRGGLGFKAGRGVCEGVRSCSGVCAVVGEKIEKVEKMGVEIVDTVRLTELEEKIFEILVATLQHFGLETELRVAGGWVRDKVNSWNFCLLLCV